MDLWEKHAKGGWVAQGPGYMLHIKYTSHSSGAYSFAHTHPEVHVVRFNARALSTLQNQTLVTCPSSTCNRQVTALRKRARKKQLLCNSKSLL